MRYTSTRDNNVHMSATEAILQGLSNEGGLFVPESIPVPEVTLTDMAQMNYREVAYEVMKGFLDDFTEEELKACINAAYDEKFDTPEIAPLTKVNDAYVLELWHGKTIAFKDMALSILPHLLTTSARKNEVTDEIVILTATSGDTGKAALAGFADVPGTSIIVFYPKDGVSSIQERQMLTQEGGNTHVIGIRGNFDDAQTGVKNIFNDSELKAEMLEKGYRFSSANSINIGRLVPQIVYYFYAYTRLLKDGVISEGEKINFDVPTGNFGNILAAYYAQQMGLPVNKLICASNENKVLYDFFETGRYDRNREFILTTSPSMDILISSNLERLLYEITGKSSERTLELMDKLKNGGVYEITAEEKEKLASFTGGFATQEEDSETIRKVFEDTGYVLDTHTGVAYLVHEKYVEKTGDDTITVIDSTASPYKFARSVMEAIGEKTEGVDDFALIDGLNKKTGMPVPAAVEELRGAKIRHDSVCEASTMKDEVRHILGM